MIRLKEITCSPLIIRIGLVHVLIFLFMILCRLFHTPTYPGFVALLEGALVNWDAKNYLQISQFGYEERNLIVFFPFYPWLISLGKIIVFNSLLSALVVNLIFHLLTGVYLFKLFRLDYSEEFAKKALLFFLIFPTSFAMVVPYSESIFFFLGVASFYFFRSGKFVQAGLLGGLACLTRPTGVALIPLMLAEYFWYQRERTRKKDLAMVVLLCISGVFVYLGINYFHYDNPFYFMDIKGLIYKTRFTLPHVGFLLNLNYWNSGETWKVMTMGFSELLGALLVWGTGFYAYTKIRKSYAIYCLASAILFTFQAKWQSIFRYCFVLFPIFIMMVQISKKGWIRDLLIGLSLIFLALLCMQYARGHWAF